MKTQEEKEYERSRAHADRLAKEPGESGEPIFTLMGWADAETECWLIENEKAEIAPGPS